MAEWKTRVEKFKHVISAFQVHNLRITGHVFMGLLHLNWSFSSHLLDGGGPSVMAHGTVAHRRNNNLTVVAHGGVDKSALGWD